VHALVVKAVPLGPEQRRPILAKIQVIVVLADDVIDLRAQRREDLSAVIELRPGAELGEIAAKHYEVWRRVQQVRLGHRADETAVPVAHKLRTADILDMGVGDVGEREAVGFLGERELEQRYGQRGSERRCGVP